MGLRGGREGGIGEGSWALDVMFFAFWERNMISYCNVCKVTVQFRHVGVPFHMETLPPKIEMATWPFLKFNICDIRLKLHDR